MDRDIESLIEECRCALGSVDPAADVRDILGRWVVAARTRQAALNRLIAPGMYVLHRAANLTILEIVWAPGMAIMPHDHRMWAVIGIYGGREDNLFWRRVSTGLSGAIEPSCTSTLQTGDVTVLAPDVIHSVTNPGSQLTSAIHVYGGDFFDAARSEWDAATLIERPFDPEHARHLFAGGP